MEEGAGRGDRFLAAEHEDCQEEEDQEPTAAQATEGAAARVIDGGRRCKDIHGGQYVRRTARMQMKDCDTV